MRLHTIIMSFLVAGENESGLRVSRGTLTAVNRYRVRKRVEILSSTSGRKLSRSFLGI